MANLGEKMKRKKLIKYILRILSYLCNHFILKKIYFFLNYLSLGPFFMIAFPLIFIAFDKLKIVKRIKIILVLCFAVLLTLCAVINYTSYAEIETLQETRIVSGILLENGCDNGFLYPK